MAMFSTGQTIRSRAGNEYEIIDLLGAGVTAEVYRASRRSGFGLTPAAADVVALKVLREGLADEIEQNFRDEAVTLGKLSGAAAEHDPRVATLIPRIVENASLSEQAETRFIAFEYISVPSLDRVLADSGPLDEQTALAITSQVLSILHVLHTALRKSYTDFQLQNIRWNADTGLVKVIDWNHLSLEERDPTQPPRGAADDLTRMAAYLYQMVTGAGARLSGESLHQLQSRGGERWDALTLGAQALIARGLHLNPARRFPTAADFRAAVDEHFALWTKDLKDLKFELLGVVRPIDQESSEGRQADPRMVERAQVLTNMLARREPDAYEIKRSRAVIDDVVGEISPAWAAGYQDYQRAAYQQAAATWEEEAKALGRVELRRWVMAAQTGAALGKEAYAGNVRPPLERALEAMKNHDWKPAAETLRAIPERQSVPPLRALLAEAEAQLAFQQARAAEGAGNWREAARAYEELLERLPEITYSDAVSEAFGWEEEALRRAAARNANFAAQGVDALRQRQEVESALQGDFDAGLKLLIQELQKQPDQPALVELAAASAAERPPRQAQHLLHAALSWARLSPDEERRLRQQWRATEDARLAALAADAIGRRDPHDLAERLSDLRGQPPPDLRRAARQWYDDAVRAGALPLAARLADALGRWDGPAEAEQRAGELDRLRQRAAQDSDNWQNALLLRVQKLRDAARYTEADAAVAEAEAYFGDDAAFKTRLNQLKSETQWERLLRDADRRLNGQPGLVDVAFGREALEQARRLLPTLADDDKQPRREQQLSKLEADVARADARLAGERYLASAEAWLKWEPRRWDAAAADYAEAEKWQDAFDAGQKDRLGKVRSRLNNREAYDNLYTFRHWLAQAENSLAQSSHRAAAPMAEFAAGYRATLPPDWNNSLNQDDQRLARVQAGLEEWRKRAPTPDDSGGQPVIVIETPPDTWREKLRKWLHLPLLGLALLLLIALLAGAARVPAALRAVPTQIAEVGGNVIGVRGAVDSLRSDVGGLALALTPAPTLPVVLPPTATAAPPTPLPTPSPLSLGVETISTPARADTPAAFFDLPDLRLGAPAGWQFDLSQPVIVLQDEQGGKWWLVLDLIDPTGNQAQELRLDRTLTPAEGATAATIDVIWSRNKTAAPLSPGDYRMAFRAINQTTREERTAVANMLTVQTPPLRVTIDTEKEGAALRVAPDWAETALAADVTFPATQEFEALGQKSAPCAPEMCDWPEAATAVMLLVRPTGQRQTYWLGDYHAAQFAGDTWAAGLAALPTLP